MVDVLATLDPDQAVRSADAVGELFEQHGRRVFRAAYRIVGDVQDAEDVLQTVFAKAMDRARDRASAHVFGAAPGSYLARSAVNAAIDVLRRRTPINADDVEADGVDEAAGDMEDAVWRREVRRRLRAALAELPPNWAEMVALRYFEDHSNAEVAALLGTSASTVAVTLHRARGRLRAALASPDMDEE